MNADSQAAVIINDLDSIMHRIDALPAHEYYTEALTAVYQAKTAMTSGRRDLHERERRTGSDLSDATSNRPERIAR